MAKGLAHIGPDLQNRANLRNLIKAQMGVESSAVDLLTMSTLKSTDADRAFPYRCNLQEQHKVAQGHKQAEPMIMCG